MSDQEAGGRDGDGAGDDRDDHDPEQYHHHHHDLEELGVALLTVSSTRSLEDDPAGEAVVEAVEAAGHSVVIRELVRDEYDGVQATVNRFVDREDTDCVVTTGGTGVTPDDVTLEAVDPLFDKRLPGFGELFRTLSYEEVGTRAICTRASAGVADSVPVFCLPGSENAARLGAEEIIVEEAGHLAGLARRDTEV
jgi:molybdenum cofactor biosynthesis protein B